MILYIYFVLLEFRILKVRATHHAILVLAVVLAFFDVAEVFEERARKKRRRDLSYSLLVSTLLGNQL